MNYTETIEYIHSTPKFSRILGNDLLRKLLEKLGNPQKDLKFIHIAGTNGKGSCAIMLSEILTKSGYKTGLFTSPYIEIFNERIKINGEMISNEALAKITTKIRATLEKYDTPVSEFALDTAIAFEYFKKKGCDIVVLETGLGGRLDATNVIDNSIISILMSIDMDHTQYLGNTISEIAAEKCGIIKENSTVVVYPIQFASAKKVIKSTCTEKNAELIFAKVPTINEGTSFTLKRKKYTLSMVGDFQKYNASTVIEVINQLNKKGWNIPPSAINNGLLSAFNPARYEKLSNGLILDGAHNISAIKELCHSLLKEEYPPVICIAMMEDKDISSCVAELAKINPKVIVTKVNLPRCVNPKKLCKEFEQHGIYPIIIKDPVKASKAALSLSFNNRTPVVCGSLYLMGEVRKNLFNHKASPLYYVYIMRCKDNSLYTGITTDVERRFFEHSTKDKKGAKYTSARQVVSLEAVWEAGDRSFASVIEAFIKKQSKATKEELIKNNALLFKIYNESIK